MMAIRKPAAVSKEEDRPVIRSLCGSPSNFQKWREELATRNLPVIPPPLKKKSTLAGRKFKKEAVFREGPIFKSQYDCRNHTVEYADISIQEVDSRNELN